ncbi:hypothetical protein MSR1_06840 [Magnetospirillum gryphiswaldense MSR-1]|uniref:Transposase n=1 Tax=Magnetospirillum gryphiswaldense TaxID=55518 RepID=A4TWF3_9PROT|nr:hypothetical protein MSR1_06840 [Magnetospirillum gryphiswaldense MSR-1]AVM77095.1 hypothetical protein MSR1L_06840 [Magnetospirillum gryphiswaldense]CAM74960.1 transposase [Magnetospirillum gryphiswaldense MSR-1]
MDGEILRDDQWDRLREFVPGGRKGKRGPRSDARRFLDAILWLARSGARWRDLPEDRFGPYQTVKRRYYRWIEQGVGTLHRLKQACDALVASGKDFALKDIEAYCKVTFSKGPNAQSISNDKALRAYVDARRGEADLVRRGKARSPLDQDIEAIPDLDLRSRMRLLAEDFCLERFQYGGG